MGERRTFTSFEGTRQIASGELRTVLLATKTRIDGGAGEAILIFEDWSGRQVDFDFRGTPEEVVERARAGEPRSGPGRPRLGVVSREVTLLPRHWEWLEGQPSGISAAVRRLVDEARKREPAEQSARIARDAAGKFMWAMAGNLPGFEEASRALYAGDRGALERLSADWPADIRTHLMRLLNASDRPDGES